MLDNFISMRTSIIVFIGSLLLSFTSLSQDVSNKTYEAITSCESCKEVIMISAGLEKKYTGLWFESMELKDGFLVFIKGSQTHRWNLEKVVFIEQNASYTRVYLEQAR